MNAPGGQVDSLRAMRSDVEKIEPLNVLNTREVPKISQIFVSQSFREHTLAPVIIQTWRSGGKRDIFRVDAIISELRLWRGRARFIEKCKGIR